MSDTEAQRQRLRLMQMQARLRLQTPQGAAGASESREAMHERLRARLAAGEAGISPEARQRQAQIDAQGEAEIARARRESLSQQYQPGVLQSAIAGASQGLTFGFGDEILGALGGAVGALHPNMTAQEGYTQTRDAARAYLDASRRENPVTTFAGEIAGAAVVPVGGAASGATTAARIGRSAMTGAAAGGVYGAGVSEGQTAGEIVADAGRGAAAGAAVGAVVPAIAARLTRRQAQRAGARAAREAARAAPSGDDLRSQASALYEAARARGVVVQQDHFADFAQTVGRQIMDEGADDILTPRTNAVLRRLREIVGRETDVSLNDMDQLRRVMGVAATSADRNERRLAGMMIQRLDDYMVGLSDDALRAGSADGLGAELAQAREMWARMSRHQVVEEAITRAQDAASGFENGLRVEFRRLLRDGRFMRSISAEERDAIRSVVRGTPMGNFLRTISGWGGGRDAQRNLLSGTAGMMLGGGAGSAIGGPIGGAIGAAAPVLIGRAAAGRSEAMTNTAAETARRLIAAGGLSAEQRAALAALPDAALARLIEGRAAAYAPAGLPVVDAMAPRAR